MRIILEPLVNRWATSHIHPGKFKQHIIEDGISLNTLGRCTDTLHIITLGKSLKVTVHRCLQAAMQSAASTKVMQHTIYIWTAIEIVCSPLCSIVGIYIVGKQVKTDEAVAILTHCTERTTLWHTLPVLDNPFRLLIDIIRNLFFLTHSIMIVVEFHHDIRVTSLVCHATGK